MESAITNFLIETKDQIKFASRLINQVLSSYHLEIMAKMLKKL